MATTENKAQLLTDDRNAWSCRPCAGNAVSPRARIAILPLAIIFCRSPCPINFFCHLFSPFPDLRGDNMNTVETISDAALVMDSLTGNREAFGPNCGALSNPHLLAGLQRARQPEPERGSGAGDFHRRVETTGKPARAAQAALVALRHCPESDLRRGEKTGPRTEPRRRAPGCRA